MIKRYKTKDSSDMTLYKYIGEHKTLNPKLWEDGNLKPEVRSKIDIIVDTFKTLVEKDNVELFVMDVCIVGSNAGYNYTEYSDIDIHILANFEIATCDKEHLQALYSNYKRIFEKKYYPCIYGYEVEIYVEDFQDQTNVSTAMFSLNEGWIREPLREKPVINSKEIQSIYEKYKSRISDLENSITGNDHLGKLKEVERILSDIYEERKLGLSRSGEFSSENIAFKELRSKGYIAILKNLKTKLTNAIMSLDSCIKDSQSQEIKSTYKRLSDLNGTDIENMMYGKDGYFNSYRSQLFESYYPNTDPMLVKEWFEDFADWYEEITGKPLIIPKVGFEL